MLRISDDTIEKIASDIVGLIRQGETVIFAEGGGLLTDEEEQDLFWHEYIKRVDPHEKKYIDITKRMLGEQANEIIKNIRKYPDNYKKWTFNKKYWLKAFTEAEVKFITKLYKQEGQRAIDEALRLARKHFVKAEEIPISIAFDIENPLVIEELLRQTKRFPAGLNGTTEEIIRGTIGEGIKLGESIDKIAKRVEERLGPSYIKNRAENIARSETIYASNAGAELGYLQSGVVEGKEWLTAIDEKTCNICLDMDGMTAPLGTSSWEKEGLNLGDVKNTYNLDFDYTDGEMPHAPIHSRCRCSMIPIVK